MVTVYNDYSEEPPDVFEPLPETLAAYYYNLELGDYTEDFSFYQSFLPSSGQVLELGCGSGRLTRLIHRNVSYTGLDLSLSALQYTPRRRPASCRIVCGDMRQWAFSICFRSIIIPYNTLNLLTTKEQIQQCLCCCHLHLEPEGLLLVQLYTATAERISNEKRTFQFKVLRHPDGGKIIKEILQGYNEATQTLEIEERFRIRPATPDLPKKDYRTNYCIAAFPVGEWLSIFDDAGFQLCGMYGDSNRTPYTAKNSSLFLALTPHVS